MLKEIFIENYKSLKNAKVEFKEGLNIIIGKNGSGKSNLLEFLSKVIGTEIFFNKQDFSNQRFPENNFSYIFYYNDNFDNQNELVVKLPSDEPINTTNGRTILISQKHKDGHQLNDKTVFSDGNFYKLNDKIQLSSGSVSPGVSEFSTVLFILSRINGLSNKYLKFDTPTDIYWLDIPNTITIDTSFGAILENENTYNYLFSFSFQYYLQNKLIEKTFDTSDNTILETIKSFLFNSFIEYKDDINIDKVLLSFTSIEDIRINNNTNIHKLDDKILIENLTFDFKINDSWIPWSYLSDGTKRLFYLISEINSCKNGVILIEEPELGIHPHQLYKLMQFIKEQSEDKQIIISTHSPLILDSLQSNELDRIIVAKIENGSSKFERLSENQIAIAKKYMEEVNDLSYYWLHSDLEEND